MYKEICQDSQVDMDEIPDSPSTLLGEDFDMDEMCQSCSISTSEKRFIIPETPPRSPSTVLGSTYGTDEMSIHSLDSDKGLSSDMGDSPCSPTTVLGDDFFDGADSGSLTPELDVVDSDEHSEAGNTMMVEAATRTRLFNGADSLSLTSESDVIESDVVESDVIESDVSDSDDQSEAESAIIFETSTRTRKYVRWPGFPSAAVPLIYEWPAFIIEAFANRDWKFGLNSGDRAVLEVIAGREDLEAWFTKVREEWQNSRLQQGAA